MDCEFRTRLDAYHDGELSPAERACVEEHARDCPSCAADLAAIRNITTAFATGAAPDVSDVQLLQLAQSVRAEAYDARMLLQLFRGAAIAAAAVLACAIAGGVYQSHETRVAAHQAMVLDHAATWSQTQRLPAEARADARQSDQQVRLAQWIADDLQRRQEER